MRVLDVFLCFFKNSGEIIAKGVGNITRVSSNTSLTEKVTVVLLHFEYLVNIVCSLLNILI